MCVEDFLVMIKQILGRLPKKPSKSSENREFRGPSVAPSSTSSASKSTSDFQSNRPGTLNNSSPPGPDFAPHLGCESEAEWQFSSCSV